MLSHQEWSDPSLTEDTGKDDKSKSVEERYTMGKLRPQIFLAIVCATLFSSLAIYIGMKMEAVEIVTAIVGGLFGFLGGVSLKVLENE